MTTEHDSLNPLEYAPQFKRTEKARTAWEAAAEDTPVYDAGESNEGVDAGFISDTIERLVETKELIKEKRQMLEQVLRHDRLPHSETDEPYIKQAKEELGLAGEGINIQDYRHALTHNQSPAADYLINLIETYHEGVKGDIRWEVYADYVELEEELAGIKDYARHFIYPSLNLSDSVPDWLETIRVHEQDWARRKKEADDEYADMENKYKDAYLFDRQNRLPLRIGLHQAEKAKDAFTYEENKLIHSTSLVASKVSGVNFMLSELAEVEEKEIDLKPIADEVLALAEDDKEKIDTLNQMTVFLKTSIDEYNKEKAQRKNTLRYTYASDKTHTLMDEYRLCETAYAKKALPLTHYMRAIQNNVSEETEGVLNDMARGIQSTQAALRDKMYDFRTFEDGKLILRGQKINDITKKHDGRLAYQGLAHRVNQLQTGEE